MRRWLALKNNVEILAVMAVLLLAVWALVAQGFTEVLVPTPEMTAEELVSALAARRTTGAMNQMTSDLQAQTSVEDLKALMDRLEQEKQGIELAHGQSSEEQGDSATAQVEIEWGTGQKQTVEFPLKKENEIWKVSSLAPLGQ